MTHALTDRETDRFEQLIDLLADRFVNARPALLRTELDGREVAVVVAVTEDGEDFRLDPLAVLVDDELNARLTPPDA
jgi:hypothetical protein